MTKKKEVTPEKYARSMRYNGQIERRFESCSKGKFNETDFPDKTCEQHSAIWTVNGYRLKY
jgi:hypothetical protein